MRATFRTHSLHYDATSAGVKNRYQLLNRKKGCWAEIKQPSLQVGRPRRPSAALAKVGGFGEASPVLIRVPTNGIAGSRLSVPGGILVFADTIVGAKSLRGLDVAIRHETIGVEALYPRRSVTPGAA
jgi:hypothetical protein